VPVAAAATPTPAADDDAEEERVENVMKPSHTRLLITFCAAVFIGYGCAKHEAAQTTAALSFDTPDAAVDALIDALEKHDKGDLQRVLGLKNNDLVDSGDAVADSSAREAFLEKYRSHHELVAGGPNDMVLQVGEDDWPLPIPLVRDNGRWRFDGEAGADELIFRRIGRNELRTIDVMRGFVDAQNEYASAGHDGAPAGVYAQRVRSSAGKHDGLYWEVPAGETPSPAGPFLAAAADEGYTAGSARQSYHGYVYRMLLAQGPNANGGAREYIANGKLTGGFALLAYPDDYGNSGVMTFMVDQDGVVWQRDLGEDTAKLAAAIQSFDPDETWVPIAPEASDVAAAN
jgi:hypothetical protein